MQINFLDLENSFTVFQAIIVLQKSQPSVKYA